MQTKKKGPKILIHFIGGKNYNCDFQYLEYFPAKVLVGALVIT
jgi:hypothetical protein